MPDLEACERIERGRRPLMGFAVSPGEKKGSSNENVEAKERRRRAERGHRVDLMDEVLKQLPGEREQSPPDRLRYQLRQARTMSRDLPSVASTMIDTMESLPACTESVATRSELPVCLEHMASCEDLPSLPRYAATCGNLPVCRQSTATYENLPAPARAATCGDLSYPARDTWDSLAFSRKKFGCAALRTGDPIVAFGQLIVGSGGSEAEDENADEEESGEVEEGSEFEESEEDDP